MAGVVQTRAAEQSPEGVANPPGDYLCWDDYMRDVERSEIPWTVWGADEPTRHTVEQDAEYTRGLKAMRLATTLAVYRALLDGQKVPAAALDPRWRRRYGL